MTFRKWLSAAALGVAAMLPIANAADAPKENPKVAQLAKEGYWIPDRAEKAMAMLGKPAPGIALKDWKGEEINAEKMKGKIVVVDFWATWCGPCIAQIPHANEMAKKYADKGVVLFGACCPKGAEKMNETATEHKMEYPTGKLSDEIVKNWDISFWPTYAIIDRTGNLRAIGLKPDYVEKVLDEVLVEQPAPKEEKKAEKK
jgi:thiol-disulfide isomerase/thioredoxin